MNFDALVTPTLVVFMDRVRANVKRLIELAGDPDRLRVHVKTTKMPEVWAELSKAGIRHFKCATPLELEHLLPIADDIVVAYPHRGPNLARIAELSRGHRVSIVVEDESLEVPDHLGVFVDINCGMDRTGVPIADHERILRIAQHDNFRGLHAYEGHVHAGPLDERKRVCLPIYDRLAEITRMIGEVPEVVTSGSPSFVPALSSNALSSITKHRVSPGTVVFSDQRSRTDCEELDFTPAAFVLSRVVSHPAPGRFTCDAGSKAIASEAGAPVAVVLEHPEWLAQTPNEEHLPFQIETGTGERPERGETLFLFPRHVCPTVNLAHTAVLVDGTSQRTVRVAAAGH